MEEFIFFLNKKYWYSYRELQELYKSSIDIFNNKHIQLRLLCKK